MGHMFQKGVMLPPVSLNMSDINVSSAEGDMRKLPVPASAADTVRPEVSAALDRIADERNVTDVDNLLAWLEEHNHPALLMDMIF